MIGTKQMNDDDFYYPTKKDGWDVVRVEQVWNGNNLICYHTIPCYGSLHSTDGDTCYCKPVFEMQTETACTIVHNATNHLVVL